MKTLDAVNLKMGSGTLAYAATSLAGTGSWHTVFKKRFPFLYDGLDDLKLYFLNNSQNYGIT